MNKLLIIVLLISNNFFAQMSPSKNWTVYNDPMGDKKFAYVSFSNSNGNLETYTPTGVLSLKYDYTSSTRGKLYKFNWTPSTIYEYYGMKESGYMNVTVKFKVGSAVIDLETYVKQKYPNYNNYSLKVVKKYGGFTLAGYDSGYSYSNIESGTVDIEMIDLFKKATLVTIDYDGERYFISSTGFTKAFSQL